MVRMTVALVEGEGELLREPEGEEPGVPSLECRKLADLRRQGSGSRVGMPVAEVVVVHVEVDMRRIRLGGRLLRSRCNSNNSQNNAKLKKLSSCNV
jgi:hypothetical protein